MGIEKKYIYVCVKTLKIKRWFLWVDSGRLKVLTCCIGCFVVVVVVGNKDTLETVMVSDELVYKQVTHLSLFNPIKVFV